MSGGICSTVHPVPFQGACWRSMRAVAGAHCPARVPTALAWRWQVHVVMNLSPWSVCGSLSAGVVPVFLLSYALVSSCLFFSLFLANSTSVCKLCISGKHSSALGASASKRCPCVLGFQSSHVPLTLTSDSGGIKALPWVS